MLLLDQVLVGPGPGCSAGRRTCGVDGLQDVTAQAFILLKLFIITVFYGIYISNNMTVNMWVSSRGLKSAIKVVKHKDSLRSV